MSLLSNLKSVFLVAIYLPVVLSERHTLQRMALPSMNHWRNGSYQYEMLYSFFEELLHRNISDSCASAVRFLLNNKEDEGALTMFDASGKVPASIERDSMSSVGLYDQCLDIKNEENQGGTLKGRYCSMIFEESPSDNTTENGTRSVLIRRPRFQWDVCVPDNCTDKDLSQLDLLSVISVALADVQLSEKAPFCSVKEPVKLNDSQIVAISFFSLLAAFLFLGSLFDFALRIRAIFRPTVSDTEERGKILSVILAFSLYRNAKIILNTKKTAGTLDAVHGMRFLSMAWIILGHTYSFLNLSLVTNFPDVKKYEEDVAFQVVLRSSAAADTFFFLSALVIVYSTLRTLKIQGGNNWPLLYLHRFIRLTPAYAFAILFSFVMPLMGSGPFWEQNWKTVTDNCNSNWWPAILYVNNLVRTENLCLQQSWFLSNIMQFFLITPLVLVFLWKIPIVGLLLNTLFLAATFITPALLMMEKDVPPIFIPGMGNMNNYMVDIYLKPYSRIGPYCIGIYIGYLLSKKHFKIFSIIRVILWCLAIACNLAVIYGPYQWKNGNYGFKEVNAFYVASHGTGFALGLAWITYSCCTGYGGIVNKILSWRAFLPLSRITYMAFLAHPFIIYSYNWSLRDEFTVSHYSMVLLYLGFLVITYGVAFLASIIFEAPFIGLENAFLTKSFTQSKTNEIEPQQDEEELPVVNTSEDPMSSYEPIGQSRINTAFVENEPKTSL